MGLPEKIQPGPLAGRISYFAPVSLLFFFFLMFIITTLRGIELHPMNYFFLAAAFFAFHLLLAYMVDHVSIHAAFAASSVVLLVVAFEDQTAREHIDGDVARQRAARLGVQRVARAAHVEPNGVGILRVDTEFLQQMTAGQFPCRWAAGECSIRHDSFPLSVR